MSSRDDEPLLPVSETGDTAPKRRSRKQLIIQFIALVIFVLVLLGVFEAIKHSREPAHKEFDFHNLPGAQPGLRNPAYFARGRNGAVATEVDICSDVGVDVLKDGGNAVDAAIASCLCIGTTNMFASGIGGGGFMTIRPADKKHVPISIDFRETAPTGSHPTMHANTPGSSRFGGLAVGVPGELRGLEAAYKAYGGAVSWQRLFEPAIKLAEGHEVGADLDRRLKFSFFSDFMKDDPIWRAIFMPKGKFLVKGDTIRRPALAKTLRAISKHGADAFYSGRIAKSMAETVQAAGGLLTTADLAAYKAIVQPAFKGSYRNRTIYTTHAPSSGPILISLLNTLEPLTHLPDEGRTGLNVHRFVESQKFAFATRTEFGDPAFVSNAKRWEEVTTKQYGREVLAKINDNKTHTFDYYGAKYDIHDDHGTTHISVVDKHGGAVSLTSTVNLIFGSRLMDEETGVILNDEMDDFATPGRPDAFGLRPSPYNYPEGPHHSGGMGKKPLSSTSASILEYEDGSFWMALGGSGGSRIFGAVAQVILNTDWGYDLSHAIEEPRVHSQLLPAYVAVESGGQPDIEAALKARGHNVTVQDINIAACEVQAVSLTADGWFVGASDSRKNGRASAY